MQTRFEEIRGTFAAIVGVAIGGDETSLLNLIKQ
jgi:hypothetical protein